MTRTRTSTAATVGALVLLGTAACGSDDGGASSSGGATGGAAGVGLVNPGTLTTCTHLPYEPFQFQQGDEVVGFDVDVVTRSPPTSA